MKTENEDGLM